MYANGHLRFKGSIKIFAIHTQDRENSRGEPGLGTLSNTTRYKP